MAGHGVVKGEDHETLWGGFDGDGAPSKGDGEQQGEDGNVDGLHGGSLHFPNLHVINPHGVWHQKAEPAFHWMSKAFRVMTGEHFAIEAEAHFVAFGDENQFMPFSISFPGDDHLLGVEQGFEVSGWLFFAGQIIFAAFAVLQIHDAGFVINQCDAALAENPIAEMSGVNAFRLTVHEAKLL